MTPGIWAEAKLKKSQRRLQINEHQVESGNGGGANHGDKIKTSRDNFPSRIVQKD